MTRVRVWMPLSLIASLDRLRTSTREAAQRMGFERATPHRAAVVRELLAALFKDPDRLVSIRVGPRERVKKQIVLRLTHEMVEHIDWLRKGKFARRDDMAEWRGAVVRAMLRASLGLCQNPPRETPCAQ
jgi:hypothetical protein